MHTLFPDGEEIRRAVKWVSANLQDNPRQSAMPLVQEAIFTFDLSPKEAEFLTKFYRKRKEDA